MPVLPGLNPLKVPKNLEERFAINYPARHKCKLGELLLGPSGSRRSRLSLCLQIGRAVVNGRRLGPCPHHGKTKSPIIMPGTGCMSKRLVRVGPNFSR